MTDDNNRIIQGGELELEEGSLDEVVTESPQTESATQTTSTANGFPEVDMSFLNKSVLIYLQNITNKDEGITIFDGKEEGEINVTSKLLAGYVGMLEMLGNAFFTMDELKYVESQGVYYLQANLKLSDEISVDVLKKGIQSLVGKDSVDYFMEEFGDRLGITDETGTIELSNPELNRYLPFMGEIKNIEGRRIVRRDPNLLLLSLEPEDRKYISLFWNEVYKNKQAPFDVDFQPTNKMGWVEVKEYALDSEDIARIVSRPQIVGFSELVNIGKKHRISGLASYADKLEQFREDLAMIPRD